MNRTENLGHYHIATVGQLNELPSQVVHMLSMVKNVVRIKVEAHKPGDTVDCNMWGQPVTMTYEVARHLATLHALEN
jgi:hypothetical protein